MRKKKFGWEPRGDKGDGDGGAGGDVTAYWLEQVALVAEAFGLRPEEVLRWRTVEFVGWLETAEGRERSRVSRMWEAGMAARQLELDEDGLESFRDWVSGIEPRDRLDAERVAWLAEGLRSALRGE